MSLPPEMQRCKKILKLSFLTFCWNESDSKQKYELIIIIKGRNKSFDISFHFCGINWGQYDNDFYGRSNKQCDQVACTINIYNCKFYDHKVRLSLERNYDCTIVILAKASLNYNRSLRS